MWSVSFANDRMTWQQKTKRILCVEERNKRVEGDRNKEALVEASTFWWTNLLDKSARREGKEILGLDTQEWMDRSRELGAVEIHKGTLTEQAALLRDTNHLMSIQHKVFVRNPTDSLTHISRSFISCQSRFKTYLWCISQCSEKLQHASGVGAHNT